MMRLSRPAWEELRCVPDACLSCLLHCFSFLPFRQRLRPRTRRPYRHPCLLQSVPPSPRKSNNSDNDRDLRYLRFLNKGSQLKELAELLTKAERITHRRLSTPKGVG